jgi:two-component system, OmpR family, sensor histidine kinase CpxA
MRGLFFKIFIIFWIAQSLIFVISTTLIIRHRFQPSPDVLRSSLYGSLRAEAAAAAAGFESGGCEALRSSVSGRQEEIALEDAAGRNLCASGGIPSTVDTLSTSSGITGSQVNSRYIWTVPIVSASGKQYLLRLGIPHPPEEHSWYHDLLHFAFPQLPVAIAVGGATTFALVLLFTRPVIRLRRAARELAHGNLGARVKEAGPQSRIFRGDEFQALVHDFNHMADRLESLVDAQKLLLRDVSHELRSPLARLSVALELAREDAGEEMKAHLDRIERETERLNQLIGQLLTLSSMEAAEGAEDFGRISLKQLLEELIPDAEYEARQRQSSVTLHAEGDVAVRGKRELLYRAIENVVRNAIRYTEPGTEVEIRLAASHEGSNRIATLEINDRGPGIPEKEMESIFRPFYRVDQARSPHTGGFGVGLAIAERSVKLHHGEVRAFNRKEGGTTVQMRFPAI